MAEATLEPPPQAEIPATPEGTAAAKTALQEAFDRVAPLKTKKGQVQPPTQPKPETSTPAPTPEPTSTPEVEHKLPSFVTQETPAEVKPAEPEIKLDDLPKEAPEGADEKTKINWKKTRSLLESQDRELKALRDKQSQKEEKGKELSPVDATRLQELEKQNQQYSAQLKAFGLQQDPTFVNQIIRPLQSTYSEAKRIIKDAGANPEQLDKALMLTGKAHYDAMDELLGELPESAKGELTSTMRDYRKLAQARAEAMANAPKVYDELQKQNTIKTKEYFDSQKAEASKRFEDRVKFLRDEAHLETLMESQEAGTEWWNEIPKKVIQTAKMIALENQDMDVVMDASILAASAISYRDMYKSERDGRLKAEKELREIKGAEPRVTDAGSPATNGKVDIKEPLENVFLRQLKQSAGR